MGSQCWLKFDGLECSVHLDVDKKFFAAIGAVFSGWRFELCENETSNTFSSIFYDGENYTISSPFMDGSEIFADPVNTLCRLVVEVAWAQLRERPEMLCLHGAAVKINGRLVVFPSMRHAGKSTFSLGMMAAGQQLFTDDFLPLLFNDENAICGFAQGISPRLRLPLPEQAGPVTSRYFEKNKYIENQQYRYVVPGRGDAAGYGDIAAIGALVFLERNASAQPELTRIEASEALQSLITQNFARSMNASAILGILSETATNVPAYKLSYANVDQAVEIVSGHFEKWPDQTVSVNNHDFGQAPEPANHSIPDHWRVSRLVQMADVTEKTLDSKKFLSGNSDRVIVSLNECAAGIWRLLAEPTTFSEIVDILCAAFPEQNPSVLKADAESALQSFVDHQFVRALDQIPDLQFQISAEIKRGSKFSTPSTFVEPNGR